VARGLHLDLTAEQQSQIITASHAVSNPETFARTVREQLAASPEIGDGLVYRTCRSLQPRYFTAPRDHIGNGNRHAQQLRKFR
jgi:hypothetical protein